MADDESGLQRRWWVPCEDSMGDTRRVTVLAPGDRVVVVLPPGEVARFTAQGAEVLVAALRDAVRAARQSKS